MMDFIEVIGYFVAFNRPWNHDTIVIVTGLDIRDEVVVIYTRLWFQDKEV